MGTELSPCGLSGAHRSAGNVLILSASEIEVTAA